jgi:hypothetical protein
VAARQAAGVDAVKCDYCGSGAVRATGKEIYPHRPELYSKLFYLCRPCDAYVGCHPGTWNPLGRLANKELRRAKQMTHAVFDPLWKGRKMPRSLAYARLAERMGIDGSQCHIGMFDLDLCRKAYRAARQMHAEIATRVTK